MTYSIEADKGIAGKDGKTQLLRSLSIERAAPQRGSSRLVPTLAVAGAAVLVLAAAVLWRVETGAPVLPPRDPAAAQQTAPVARTQAAPNSPAAGPSTAAPASAAALIASGYVVARRTSTVAAEITGKVKDLLVEEGQTVKEGQVLARLDSVLAEEDLALSKSRAGASEAAIAAIAADLADAERILNRTQTLSQKSYATEADLTKAQSTVDRLRAQLRQAEAQHATDVLDAERYAAVLEKYAIRAPFSGVVIDRSAQPGEMISPMSAGGFTRTGICTLVDMDSIEVEVDVNEAYIGRVHDGDIVHAALDAYPDWTIPGAVIAIVPTANREKATVKVRVKLDQKDPRILPDMAIKVTFLDKRQATQAETPRSY